jgi:hypothetical protein
MMAVNGTHKPNPLALAAGFGIGVLWIAMALWSLIAAARGYADNRSDYGLIWAVVGVLLLGAGIAALVGTWWHQFALPRRRAAHAPRH